MNFEGKMHTITYLVNKKKGITNIYHINLISKKWKPG